MSHIRNRSAMTNSEGYSDPTAYHALKNLDNAAKSNERFHAMLKEIWAVCKRYDFQLVGRIAVRDKRTDQIWR